MRRCAPWAMFPESQPATEFQTAREVPGSTWRPATGALLLVLVLGVLQLSFFLADRTPMTWDPSLHHHLALRLLDAVRERGAGELVRAWTASEHIYPPLYTLIHVPIFAFVGPSPRAAQAVEGLWLLLLALTIYFAAGPRKDPLRAAALALACATSPLLLSLARVTYIENLLTLEIAWAALLARRWSRGTSLRDACLFGVVAGAALLTKWSAAVFLVPIVVAGVLVQRRGSTPASASRMLRSLVAAAAPCLALAVPWYLSEPSRLAESLVFESFEKVDGAALLSWGGSAFYLRALASELFWFPVALALGFWVTRTWGRSDPSGRRYWALATAGAIVLLTLVPHHQARFAAALVPLTILGVAEVTQLQARARTRLLLLGLAALSGLALSVPGFGAPVQTGRWSPQRGVPELWLGTPSSQAWPHDALLSAAAASGSAAEPPAARPRNVETGSAAGVHLQVVRGHPYLNFWTFQSHAWAAGVRMVRNPANASYILSVTRSTEPIPSPALASSTTPDGYRCSLLRQQLAKPDSPRASDPASAPFR